MKREKPWTWEEIADLHGPALAKFLTDYGDRGKAAIVVANQLLHPGRLTCTWRCACCPMAIMYFPTKWSIAVGLHICCPDNAIPIYRLMIAKLGRLPEVKP